jgi:alginate O-acetyltransferase complex protein AlgI
VRAGSCAARPLWPTRESSSFSTMWGCSRNGNTAAACSFLLTTSYAFYALSSRIYLVLLIVASAAIYALGLAIARSRSERAKQAYMAAGVAAVVAVIVAFKGAGAWRGLLLPLGVSYYSFKLISYLIEVY